MKNKIRAELNDLEKKILELACEDIYNLDELAEDFQSFGRTCGLTLNKDLFFLCYKTILKLVKNDLIQIYDDIGSKDPIHSDLVKHELSIWMKTGFGGASKLFVFATKKGVSVYQDENQN